MAYTRTWNNATPAGTRAAKEIDDSIREFKTDFSERFTTLLDPATTIDTDPLVLKPAITGAAAARVLVFPPTLCQPLNDDDDVRFDLTGYFEGDNNPGHLSAFMPLVIPVGYTIKLFEFYADKLTGASVVGRLLSIQVGSGAVGGLDSGDITRSVAGVGVGTSAALNYLTVNSEAYFARFTGVSGSRYRIYGVRITYDKADGSTGY